MATTNTARSLPSGFTLPAGIKPFFAALAVAWAVAFIAGMVGVAERITEGHRSADYGSYVTWGLWVAAYQYLVEMAAGAFIIAAAIYLLRLERVQRVGPAALLLGIASLISGMMMVWLDLGRMERFWRVIFTPNFDSIIAWVVMAYTAFLIISAVALWFSLRATLAKYNGDTGLRAGVARVLLFGQRTVSESTAARDIKVVRVLMVVGLVPAIGFAGGEGALFGVVGARPYWNSPTLPISFIASAVVTAGATLTVLSAFFLSGLGGARDDVVHFLGRTTLAALAALLVLEFAEFSIGLYSSVPAQERAYEEILTGDYWWSFWIIHLFAGAAVPFAIFVLRGNLTAWMGAAALLAGAGMFTVRLNAVIPGQVVPQLEGLSEAFWSPRLQFDYFPSTMEWLVTIFVVAVGVALFYAGYRLLPVSGEAPGGPAAPSTSALEGGE